MKRKINSKIRTGIAILTLSVVLSACGSSEKSAPEPQTQVQIEDRNRTQTEEMQTNEVQVSGTQINKLQEIEGVLAESELSGRISHTVREIPLDLKRYWFFDHSEPVVVKDTIYFPVSGVVIEEEENNDFDEIVMELQIVAVNSENTKTDIFSMQQQGKLGDHRDEYNYEYIFYTNPVVTADGKVYAIRNHVFRKYEDVRNWDALTEPEKEIYHCYLDCWELTGKSLFEINIDTCKEEEDPYLPFAQICDLKNGSVAVIAAKETMGFYTVDAEQTLSGFIPFVSDLSYRNGFDRIIEDGKGQYSILAYGEDWDFNHRMIADIDFVSGKQVGEIHTIPNAVAEVLNQVFPGKNTDYILVNGNQIYTYTRDEETAFKIMDIGETQAEELVSQITMVNGNTFIGTGFYPGAERSTVSVFTIEKQTE